jgi:hypothetical protein
MHFLITYIPFSKKNSENNVCVVGCFESIFSKLRGEKNHDGEFKKPYCGLVVKIPLSHNNCTTSWNRNEISSKGQSKANLAIMCLYVRKNFFGCNVSDLGVGDADCFALTNSNCAFKCALMTSITLLIPIFRFSAISVNRCHVNNIRFGCKHCLKRCVSDKVMVSSISIE